METVETNSGASRGNYPVVASWEANSRRGGSGRGEGRENRRQVAQSTIRIMQDACYKAKNIELDEYCRVIGSRGNCCSQEILFQQLFAELEK